MKLENQRYFDLWDQLRRRLWGPLWSQLSDQLRCWLWGPLWSQLRGRLQDQLMEELSALLLRLWRPQRTALALAEASLLLCLQTFSKEALP